MITDEISRNKQDNDMNEKVEPEIVLEEDQPQADEIKSLAPVKLYYKVNRHDRRKAAAIARHEKRKNK